MSSSQQQSYPDPGLVKEPSVESAAWRRKQWTYLGLAFCTLLPTGWVRLMDHHPTPLIASLIFGLAIVGAAFILAWAAEVVQMDITAGLALALLALIAVLPEYAVDFVFTWKAGSDPDQYAPLALANMTGGNQLLIGLGWPLVVLLATYRIKRAGITKLADGSTPQKVALNPSNTTEIAFLSIASLYGLYLPARVTLWWIDTVVLVLIFAFYLWRLAQGPTHHPDLVGPARLIGSFSPGIRRLLNLAMFVIAAGAILLAAEPFAESLVEVGERFNISKFLLVKWIAPVASESPELLVAALFAWRFAPSVGLGALVSSKINQWTLLVGSLPLVFALSSQQWGDGLPIGVLQREELAVTAAQSVFAVAIIASMSMSRVEAWWVLALFAGQVVSSGILPEEYAAPSRIVVAAVFILGAIWVFIQDRSHIPRILREGIPPPR